MPRTSLPLALAALLSALPGAAWASGHALSTLSLTTLASAAPPRAAAPLARAPAAASSAAPERLLGDVQEVLKAAEQVPLEPPARSDAELAERLVAGQVLLEAGDGEGAAVVFLDLLEGAPNSPAAGQARYYLGEALLLLGMHRWAGECFSLTLADPGVEARRFHQHAVARLLGLAAPPRPRGHARRPGPSVMPELRARLQAAGVAEGAAPAGTLRGADVARLRGWVLSVAAEQRIPELRYAWGRFLFLSREYEAALAELDALAPPDMPLGTSDRAWKIRLRANYVAGAALAALARVDEALVRFDRIAGTRALPGAPEQEIRDLAWMARARVLHDRGDFEGALRGYQAIGRGSPLYASALYETAWTLLHADRHDAALAALQQLLRDVPQGLTAPEAKALRGKLQIRRRDWKAAEQEFTALRADYERQYRALAPALAVQSDALSYTAALVRSDPRAFSLDALVPRAAIPLARNLPRGVQAERLAREAGEVDHMLRETLALLERMELAAASPERALLFTDLGAHWRALDAAARDLGEAGEALLAAAGQAPSGSRDDLRRQIDLLFSRPSKQVRRLADLGDQVHAAQLEASFVRSRVLGLEHAHRESGKRGGADPFFAAGAAARDELGALERSVQGLQRALQVARATARFTDPLPKARREALAAHNEQVGRAGSGAPDDAARALWVRRQRLLVRLDAARARVLKAADARLARALVVLREERDNLTRHAAELDALRPRAEALAAEAALAAVRDVAADLRYWTTRAEVGLLDVAWATKEAELEQARDLERAQGRNTKAFDRAIEGALEDSE